MTLLRCAKCGRRVRKPVVYGYPGPDLMEQAGRGEVVLGGCEIGEPLDPWWCDDCRPESLEEREAERARAAERRASEESNE